MIRETAARWIMCAACVVALAALIPACPHPSPTPVNPDASDAARPPKTVSCATACDRAITVCSNVNRDACLDGCNRIRANDPGFAPCIAAATSCPALTACDPLARASQRGAPAKPVNGR